MNLNSSLTATQAWHHTLVKILSVGRDSSPRGKSCKELFHHTVEVNMRHPVVLTPARKLSYQFMAAEACWILEGDDTVAGIEPWNKKISEFSDDGVRFFGAYGPKVVAQLPYVVNKLKSDPDSRQAVINIWRESPPHTKDIPCTCSLMFRIVGHQLNLHVFMRSSDAWLGLPYDMFNFSMIAHQVASKLNGDVYPGTLYLTMGSSHLYETNLSAAKALAWEQPTEFARQGTPDVLFDPLANLTSILANLRDTKPGDLGRWWEVK